jgi:hypothetical protein
VVRDERSRLILSQQPAKRCLSTNPHAEKVSHRGVHHRSELLRISNVLPVYQYELDDQLMKTVQIVSGRGETPNGVLLKTLVNDHRRAYSSFRLKRGMSWTHEAKPNWRV